MKNRFIALTAAAIALCVLSTNTVAHAAPTKDGAVAIYYQNTEDFTARRNLGGDGYVWDADGCTVPRGLPATVFSSAAKLFERTCNQHDFGYANFGGKGKLRLDPTEARRKSVDDYWFGQMKRVCKNRTGVSALQTLTCYANASIFYLAVRAAGSKYF